MKKIIVRILEFLLSKIQTKTLNNNIVDECKYNKVSVSRLVFKKESKIPKNIYYFFVGEKIPNYINHSINSIKNVSAGYKIDVINYNWDSFFKNSDIWDIIVQQKMDTINNFTQSQIMYVLELYKRKFLCTYGGICCDCGVYAIRNFDKILDNEQFILTKYDNKKYEMDYCFYGCVKGKMFNENVCNKIFPPINYTIKEYQSLKYTFVSGNLNNITTKCNYLQPYIYNFI